MNEWQLAGLLTGLALIACTLIVYPLRRSKVLCTVLAPLLLAGLGVGYYLWGSFASWQEFVHRDEAQLQVKNMLKTIKNPQQLIDKLQATLEQHPESAKGWYLLGRLYTSQNDNKKAAAAFAKAHALNPKDEQYTVNYAHSLWQLHDQQFTPKIVSLFDDLLKNNPTQPDALAMLAMNAFLSHAYEDAISYWQRLLKLAPEQSPESVAIRKAIAKAQEHINLERNQDE